MIRWQTLHPPQLKPTDYVVKVFPPVGWGHTNTHHAHCTHGARAKNLSISSWEYRALPESGERGDSSQTGPEGGLTLRKYRMNGNFHSRREFMRGKWRWNDPIRPVMKICQVGGSRYRMEISIIFIFLIFIFSFFCFDVLPQSPQGRVCWG